MPDPSRPSWLSATQGVVPADPLDDEQLAEVMAQEAAQVALSRAPTTHDGGHRQALVLRRGHNATAATADHLTRRMMGRDAEQRQAAEATAMLSLLGRRVGFWLLGAGWTYWLTIQPVFDVRSPLRRRFRAKRSTWADVWVCFLASIFLLAALVAGAWVVRVVLLVSNILKMTVTGFAMLIGM